MTQREPFRQWRELVDGLFELSTVTVPRSELTDLFEDETPENMRWEDLDRSHEWIDACHRILGIFENMVGDVAYDEKIRKGFELEKGHQWFIDLIYGSEFTIIEVSIDNMGEFYVLAEYWFDGGWEVFWEGDLNYLSQSPSEFVLKLISEELAYLTKLTQSGKVSLDYWQTALSQNDYSQKEWAAVRGAQRQTVNDSIRIAEAALNESLPSSGENN